MFRVVAAWKKASSANTTPLNVEMLATRMKFHWQRGPFIPSKNLPLGWMIRFPHLKVAKAVTGNLGVPRRINHHTYVAQYSPSIKVLRLRSSTQLPTSTEPPGPASCPNPPCAIKELMIQGKLCRWLLNEIWAQAFRTATWRHGRNQLLI